MLSLLTPGKANLSPHSLTPGASDAGSGSIRVKRTAAHGVHTDPSPAKRPPSWPLGEAPRRSGPWLLVLTLAVLMRRATARVGTHGPRGSDSGPRSATARARTAHSPPSWAQASVHALQALCRARQGPPCSSCRAAMETRRCCGEQGLPQAGGHPCSHQPFLGRAADWPGGAQQAGTQLTCEQVTDILLPQHPCCPEGTGSSRPAPPTCWVPRPGRHTPAPASLKAKATPSTGWWRDNLRPHSASRDPTGGPQLPSRT